VLTTLAIRMFPVDEDVMVRAFRSETDVARREELAEAWADGALRAPGRTPPSDPDGARARRMLDVVEVYRAVPSVRVRRKLLRALEHGLDRGFSAPQKAEIWSSMAAAEPDPEHRRWLEEAIARRQRGEAPDWRFLGER
jgi:hypothetical protein